jgi:SAM-dependent methyltransferase
VVDSLQHRAERVGEDAFLGGPVKDFVRVGGHCLEVLLAEGLTPSSRVLDVGCGALRVGYWLMRVLDPGRYFGIEPNQEMLRLGLDTVVEPDVLSRAHPHLAHNDDFDFSRFGERFDFVVARSIWTHASRAQIGAMLTSFAATSTPDGVFLASYRPSAVIAGTRCRRAAEQLAMRLPVDRATPLLASLAGPGSRGYTGAGWVGRSHESTAKGIVRHGLPWLTRAAAERGLELRLTSHQILNGQYWLRVRRA